MRAFAVVNNQITSTRLDERETLRQRIEHGLKLQKGEWFLDPDEGIDWHEIRNASVIGDRLLRQQMQKSILSHNEVTGISLFKIETDRASRIQTISIEIQSIYGPIEVKL